MSKLRKIMISSFIVLNLLMMVRVHLPMDKKFFETVYKPIDYYMDIFTVFQDWVMFAPDPARLDAFMTAEVEFEDGSKDTYNFPRNPDLSWGEKYVYGEKFRKIIEESIRRDDHEHLWPDTARFVLRKLKDRNFHKIPLRVHLTRHWHETEDMNKVFLPHGAPKKNYENFKFYTYEVL